MNSRQLLTIVCLVLATTALLFQGAGSSKVPWRPQGRFGKRNHVTAGDADRSMGPDFGFSRMRGIPIELFYSPVEIAQRLDKPQFCSASGLPGYPVCERSNLCKDRQNYLESILDL